MDHNDASAAFAEAAGGLADTNDYTAPKYVRADRPEATLTLATPRTYKPDAYLIEKIRESPPPGKFRLLDHQVAGVAELIENPLWLLAWEMGTAKSAVVASRLWYGIQNNEFVGPSLIVCPLSVVDVWKNELMTHAGLDCYIAAGDRKQREQALQEARGNPNAIVVANYEAVRMDSVIMKLLNFDVVVCDESHRIKNSASLTNKAVIKVAHKSRYRWCLSGTPAPNGPLDIFGQMLFLSKGILGTPYKTHFERQYAVYGREVAPGIKKIIGYNNLDKLEARVAQYSSRVRKIDCLDLPEKVFQNIAVDLTASARRVYDSIRKDSLAKLETLAGTGELTVANVLTEAMRLLQVCGGFVPDDNGTLHPIEPNAKMSVLMDFIDEFGTDTKAVVWCAFRAEVAAIARKLGTRAVVHHGGLNREERAENIAKFRGDGAQFFVATPQSAREGITLTESNQCVYYSRTYNALDFWQSQDRQHRLGQHWPVTIRCLVARNTVDEKVDGTLSNKLDLQDLLLRSCLSQIL